MKVTFVNNQYQLGGAETVIEQLRSGLGRMGYEHELYVALGKTYPRDEGVRPLYPRLLSRLWHSSLNTWVERYFSRYVWMDKTFRALGTQQKDIIHLHNFHGQYASIDSLNELAQKVPVVWTFHAFWGITGGCDHPRDCNRYLNACGDCPQVGMWPVGPEDHTKEDLLKKKTTIAKAPLTVIAPAKHMLRAIENSPVGEHWDVRCIYNGVNVEAFSVSEKDTKALRRKWGLCENSTIILVINRNFKDPAKGFPLTEEALRSLDKDENIQVVLVGVYSDWAYERLSPHIDVVDLGYIDDRDSIAQLYGLSNIFLFASQAETFPCVILEAMASSCCVVATPTSGVTEQIIPNKNGILSSKIDGASLGQSLRDIVSETHKQKELGEQARRYVQQHFTEKMMLESYLEVYQELVQYRAQENV